ALNHSSRKSRCGGHTLPCTALADALILQRTFGPLPSVQAGLTIDISCHLPVFPAFMYVWSVHIWEVMTLCLCADIFLGFLKTSRILQVEVTLSFVARVSCSATPVTGM